MTLESQYNKFLHSNPDSKFSFNEWKQWHGNQIKQGLTGMMQKDEELGVYDEPNETLNEVALEFAKDHHEMYETNNLGAMHFGFCWGAKWQEERMYSEEEVIDIAKQAFVLGANFGLIGTFNEWFEQFKKK